VILSACRHGSGFIFQDKSYEFATRNSDTPYQLTIDIWLRRWRLIDSIRSLKGGGYCPPRYHSQWNRIT
jgi:hypothetical protein